MSTNIPQEFNNFFLKDVSFVNLMTKRIFNVLIVANPYDAFMLEDDGRVDEKIFDEYMELGMRYPPTFTQVSTQRRLCRSPRRQTACPSRSLCGTDALLARHHQAHRERGHEYLRLRVLLAGQYESHLVHHQADRRQDEH